MSFNVSCHSILYLRLNIATQRNGANSESVGERQMKWATEALLPTQSESLTIWTLLNSALSMAPMQSHIGKMTFLLNIFGDSVL
jgi:hypothetical protein